MVDWIHFNRTGVDRSGTYSKGRRRHLGGWYARGSMEGGGVSDIHPG